MEKAQAAITAAEAKTTEYESRLRSARAGVFHERHERLQQVNVESEQALEEARVEAKERTANARIAIEESVEKARLQLDSMVDELTAEVLRSILPPGNTSRQEQAQ